MYSLRFRLPIVLTDPPALRRCPYCRSGLTRHQTNTRGLTDLRVGAVTVQRMLCKACRRTLTVRPDGVARSSKSLRLRALAVLLYCLGLDYRSTSAVLDAVGAPLAPSTVYNYVRAAGHKSRRLHLSAGPGAVLAVGQDTTVFKVKSRRQIVSFITDAFSGRVLRIDLVRREDAHSLAACLQKVAGPALELLVSDDADAYKPAADQLGLQHQVCTTHVRKALMRRAKDILAQTPPADPLRPAILRDTRRLRRALARGQPLKASLIEWAEQRLACYRRAPPPRKGQRASAPYRMRMLLTELAEGGEALFVHRKYTDSRGRPLLDGTNNVTERAIGWCGKVRYKLMRGMKSRGSLKDFLHLNAHMRNAQIHGARSFQMAALVS
jgi:transposase-like protein